jgi:hypothetical protein
VAETAAGTLLQEHTNRQGPILQAVPDAAGEKNVCCTLPFTVW